MVGLLLLSVSKHNMWSYYSWLVVVVRKLTHYVVVIRLDLSLVSSIIKQNMWTYYGWVCRCRRSINTMHGHTSIMVGFIVVVVRL